MQIIMIVLLLSILGVVYFRKKKESTPSEITYQQQLIEAAVHSMSNNAVVITNSLNKVVLWNNGAEKLFDYKADEMKGHDLTKIGLHLGDLVLKATPIDTEALRKNQKKVPISVTVSECKVATLTHHIAIAKNIWDRKEQESLVRREMELLSLGEKISGTGSWNWAVNSEEMVTDLVFISEGFASIFEFDKRMIDLQSWLDRVWHEDREQALKILGEAQKSQTDYTLNYRIQRRNGKVIWIHSCGKFFLTPSGNTANIIGTVQKTDTPIYGI